MIKINKKPTPDFLSKWITEYVSKHSTNPIYDDLMGPTKLKLREILYEEQLGLCCYCCRKLNYPYTHSDDSHIEHFKPKGNLKYSSLSLEYTNLHLSCSGYRNQKDCCGHKKKDWFDEELTISPLEDNVDNLFEYSIDGHIMAASNNNRAISTIDNLDLDSFNLQRQRKTAIYVSGLFDDDFDEDKREMIIDEYSSEIDDVLKSFCNAVLYCVKNNV